MLKDIFYELLRVFAQGLSFGVQYLLVLSYPIFEFLGNVVLIDFVVRENTCISVNFSVAN